MSFFYAFSLVIKLIILTILVNTPIKKVFALCFIFFYHLILVCYESIGVFVLFCCSRLRVVTLCLRNKVMLKECLRIMFSIPRICSIFVLHAFFFCFPLISSIITFSNRVHFQVK